MANPVINFIKKIYKILIVVAIAIIFFLGYNTYLVDHSLVNLRIALDKVTDAKTLAEAKKISSLLDYPLLKEASSPTGIDAKKMARLELAQDILSNPRDVAQLKDIKFLLEELISEKESANPIAAALNKVNQKIIPSTTKASGVVSTYKASQIKQGLAKTKDKAQLQENYYQLGNVYIQAKDFKMAQESFKKAIDLDPQSEMAKKIKFSLGWIKKFQGNLDESIVDFKQLIAEYPADELALLSQYQVADIYRKKKDYQQAIALYHKLADEHPELKNAELAAFQVGYIYLYDLKDYQKAQEAFRWQKDKFKGTKLGKHIDTDVIKYINKNYRQEGYIKLEDGFKLLKEGYEKSSIEKYNEAVKSFDQALQVYPEDGISYVGKALAFLWLKDKDAALRFAKKAVKLTPNDEAVSVNLGYVYLQIGLIDEAIIEYKRFISVSPFSGRGYYNLGCAYAMKNKLAEALAAFQQATKLDGKFAPAFNNQGCCLWKLTRYAEAVEAFNKAIGIEPKFLDALFNLGLVYKSMSRYEEAREKLTTVLEINPNYPDAQNQLKDIERILRQRIK